MDYDQLKTMLGAVVPFTSHINIEITDITATEVRTCSR